MKRKYSPSTNLFYLEGVHPDIPQDARDVEDSLFESIMNGSGLFGPDSDGNPQEVQRAKDEPLNALKIKSAVTQTRWHIETGGITLPTGVRIATGIDDQNRITSVIANARLAGLDSVSFKAANGWVTLTLAELEGVAAAIALHVQRCFTAERAHHDAIDALAAQHEADPEGLHAALQAYDTTQGWPATDLREPQPA